MHTLSPQPAPEPPPGADADPVTPDTSSAPRSSPGSNQIQPAQDLRHWYWQNRQIRVNRHRNTGLHVALYIYMCLSKPNLNLRSHMYEKKEGILWQKELWGSLCWALQIWDIYWFSIFPVKKTVVEMFQRLVCLVCGFMAVPNILQASHSATDLCCLNPAALHSCQTMTGGGQAAHVCVCACCLMLLSWTLPFLI